MDGNNLIALHQTANSVPGTLARILQEDDWMVLLFIEG